MRIVSEHDILPGVPKTSTCDYILRKITIILVSMLIISALYRLLSPVKEVRYNSYNKNIDCYNENSYFLPEGCSAAVRPTVAQTLTGYTVLFTSLGLIIIGLNSIIKAAKRNRSNH